MPHEIYLHTQPEVSDDQLEAGSAFTRPKRFSEPAFY